MSNTFKKGLEAYDDAPSGNQQDSQMIKMKGPLANIYREALNIVYAKPDPLTGQVEEIEDREVIPDQKSTGTAEPPANQVPMNVAHEAEYIDIHFLDIANDLHLAVETQALDVALMEKLAKSLDDQDVPPTDSFQTVYGVSRDSLTDNDIVDVTKEISTTPENERDNFYLIIDGTTPEAASGGGATERIETLGSALECLVEAHGGRVFHNLQEFIKFKFQ